MGSAKKEKDAAKSKEKTLNEQLRAITNEKDKLQDKIDDLEDSVKAHERDIAKMKAELGTAKNDLLEKDKQCKSMQKDDNKSKALTDRISLLEKQKYELDTKTRTLETEKSSLAHKVSQLEKEKESSSKKLKDLESAKEELAKQVENSASPTWDKKSKEDVQKLQKENQNLKKEKDLRKNIKDVKPNKVQGELKKLAEKIEKNSLLSDATTGYTNGVDGIASAEASEIKSNFDALQKDYESRTGEIEKLTSQLSRAKADSNSAVEKLRRSESELSQIKEKNAQLSDELLNKSRRIAGLENGGHGAGGQDTTELQRQVDELKKKLGESGGAKMKKSVKFNMEPEPSSESSGRTVKELEEALEAAYRERTEIIKTCRNEVEFHRTIASELENSIMEDFEWKLHEMEKDYNAKLKYSKEKIDEQIKEACRGILREKDDDKQTSNQ